MKTNCSHCNKEIDRKPADIKRFSKLYCSKECSNEGQKTREKVSCSHCGTTLSVTPGRKKKSKNGKFFCNKSCAASYNNVHYKKNFKDGSCTYREKGLKHLPNKCNRCSYDKFTSVLVVHHKDHDRTNNELHNLEILCPTCHCEEHLESYGGFRNKPTIENSS